MTTFTDIGNCFCGKPVYAAPGQAIVWLKLTKKRRGGEHEVADYPTHKACRKARVV